eukprot:scaffold138337_cov18-Tisochrysis_lutea.AAC.1
MDLDLFVERLPCLLDARDEPLVSLSTQPTSQGGRPRSVQGSSSFSRQSTGSTVDPPVSGKPLAPRSGRSSS